MWLIPILARNPAECSPPELGLACRRLHSSRQVVIRGFSDIGRAWIASPKFVWPHCVTQISKRTTSLLCRCTPFWGTVKVYKEGRGTNHTVILAFYVRPKVESGHEVRRPLKQIVLSAVTRAEFSLICGVRKLCRVPADLSRFRWDTIKVNQVCR